MDTKISKLTNKPVRKYDKKDYVASSRRVARCGHVSLEGRYFKCENCVPELESDDGEWNYFNLTEEE